MYFKNIAKTLKYRRVCLFVLFFELLQRMSLFAIQGATFLFLKHELKYQLHNAIGIYHIHLALSYLVPAVGTILADRFFDKLVTIVCISFLALFGNVLLVMASASVAGEFQLLMPFIVRNVELLVGVALFLRAIGLGGIREIAVSLGDDQFIPDEDTEEQFEADAKYGYHQLLHYATTVAMVLAYLVPPVLRMHVYCYEQVYCYPLALCVPTICLLLALAVLMSGFVALNTDDGRDASIVLEFGQCIKAALVNWQGGGLHWVDNASYAYHDVVLDEVKITLHVLALFVPLPIFWALCEQISSRWIYQASNMDGAVSEPLNLYVEPDQMQVLNPLLLFVVLPLLEYLLYPALVRCRCPVSTAQGRMFFGGLCAVAAFCMAGYVEYRNEATHTAKPVAGEGEIWLVSLVGEYGTIYTLNVTGDETFIVPPLSVLRLRHLPVQNVRAISFTIFWTHELCSDYEDSIDKPFVYYLVEKKIVAIIMTPWFFIPGQYAREAADADATPDGDYGFLKECASRQAPLLDAQFTNIDKCDLQLPKIGVVYYDRRQVLVKKDIWLEDFRYPDKFTIDFVDNSDIDRTVKKFLDPNHGGLDYFHLQPKKYSVARRRELISKRNSSYPQEDFSVRFRRGGVYLMFYVFDNEYPMLANITTLAEPNKESMWWQVPQLILITLGQYLYPVTLLQYSLEQARPIMKPILWTFWLLSISLGNLLVAIFSFPNMFIRELWYYVFYAALMSADCILLFIMLCNYIPVEVYLEEEALMAE